MGFFSKLFKRTSSRKPETAHPTNQPHQTGTANSSKKRNRDQRVSTWPGFNRKATLVLDSEDLCGIYVYYPSVLEHLKEGDEVTLEVLLGDTQLESTVTGGIVETLETDAMCFLYEGKPVGVLFDARDTSKTAYDEGVELFVKAEIGAPSELYPEMNQVLVHMPFSMLDRLHAIETASFEADARANGVSEDAELIEFNEWDAEDYAELIDQPLWEFNDVEFAYLPVPKGSKAKPHITLKSVDGIFISRITARNRIYRSLARAIDEYTNFYVIAQRYGQIDGDGKVGYHIYLWCW